MFYADYWLMIMTIVMYTFFSKKILFKFFMSSPNIL